MERNFGFKARSESNMTNCVRREFPLLAIRRVVWDANAQGANATLVMRRQVTSGESQQP
jgi:hypothetical protein